MVGGDGERPLHQAPLRLGLEHQGVRRGEDPGEDRQAQGRLVVCGRVEDGRCAHPPDDPDRRVVEVGVEDHRVGVPAGGGVGQFRGDRALELQPALRVRRRRDPGVGEEGGRQGVEGGVASGRRPEADHPDPGDRPPRPRGTRRPR